jgi:chromosomal replication initiation ATPase DnaA
VVVALAYEMAAQMRKYESESQKSIPIQLKKILTQDNIYEITEAVICNRRGVSISDIKTETRERHVCETRQIIYYCINELHIKMSLQQRANRYNQKHCNVLYAHGKKIPNMIETDPVFAKEIYDHIFYVREAIQNAKNELENKILINNTEK